MLQIKLLRVLGHLGASDKQASDNMYAVVADSMRRGNTGHTIGNAIVYEAVRTIANIYPSPALLQSGSFPKCHSNSSSKAKSADYCIFVIAKLHQRPCALTPAFKGFQSNVI